MFRQIWLDKYQVDLMFTGEQCVGEEFRWDDVIKVVVTGSDDWVRGLCWLLGYVYWYVDVRVVDWYQGMWIGMWMFEQ